MTEMSNLFPKETLEVDIVCGTYQTCHKKKAQGDKISKNSLLDEFFFGQLWVKLKSHFRNYPIKLIY